MGGSSDPKVGFVGLGKLGKDVSEVLADRYDLVGFDIRNSDAAVVKTATLRERKNTVSISQETTP